MAPILIIALSLQLFVYLSSLGIKKGQSQWPRGLRRRSAVARLLRSWVRIPPGAWMFVCCACCVLSGRGLCDELITRPEDSYRLWCVVVCDLETSRMRRLWPALGRSATAKKKRIKPYWLVWHKHFGAHYGGTYFNLLRNYAYLIHYSLLPQTLIWVMATVFKIHVC